MPEWWESKRSTRTGPGSRDGRWGKHPPAAYYRIWRARHPEYRERERRRALLNHAVARLIRILEGRRAGRHDLPVIVPLAFELHHRDHLDPIVALLPDVGQTWQPDAIALVPSYGALIRARRMKFRRFILAQHGVGQSYSGELRTSKQPGYPGGKDNADVGLFLVPNDHAARRWQLAYPKADVAIVGSPRLETLPQRVPGPGPVVAISFHWAAHFSPEAGSSFSHYSWLIPQLAERYTLIGHGHPLRGDLPPFWRMHDIEHVASFDEVCRRADVYVCDNSSTIYEFASTRRPVVLLNSPAYRRHVRHGLRFWDAAGVGIEVNDPLDLSGAIDLALEDSPRQRAQREAALDIVYHYRDDAARRAADAITDWAELRAAA